MISHPILTSLLPQPKSLPTVRPNKTCNRNPNAYRDIIISLLGRQLVCLPMVIPYLTQKVLKALRKGWRHLNGKGQVEVEGTEPCYCRRYLLWFKGREETNGRRGGRKGGGRRRERGHTEDCSCRVWGSWMHHVKVATDPLNNTFHRQVRIVGGLDSDTEVCPWRELSLHSLDHRWRCVE